MMNDYEQQKILYKLVADALNDGLFDKYETKFDYKNLIIAMTKLLYEITIQAFSSIETDQEN